MRALLALLFFAAAAFGADTYIVVTITPTNAPTTNGQTLVINGNTRTMTNNATGSPATSIATNNTLGGIATNVANALTRTRPIVGGFIILTPTNVVIRAENNSALVVSAAGEWATVTHSTNLATNSIAVFVPLDVEPIATRTNIASQLVSGLSQYSTQAFATNATALGNFLNLGTDSQLVKNKVFTNSVIHGGTASNVTLVEAVGTITNATVKGGLITNAAIARSFLIQTNAVGAGALRFADSAVVYGETYGANGIWWNFLDSSQDTNTVARLTDIHSASNLLYGYSASIESDLADVYSQSFLNMNGSGTNISVYNTNYWHGDLSVTPRVYTGLGNGDNYNLPFGTNAAVYASGATTVMKMNSIPAGRNYQRLRVRLSGAVTNWIVNESLGEATVTERITTGTGGDIFSTNQPSWAELEYTGSRWEVVSFR